jgi:hypothetical protein
MKAIRMNWVLAGALPKPKAAIISEVQLRVI